MFEIKKLLVLAPHTDDGELGAGAFIDKMVKLGVKVQYLAFSDCKKSLPEDLPEDTLRIECRNSMQSFGLKKDDIKVLDFDVRVFSDRRQDILDEIIKVRKEYNPDMVLVPSSSDIHQDHNVIYQEALRAFKNITLLGYELPWNCIDFRSDLIIEVSKENVEAKCKAINMYKSQNKRNYTSKETIINFAKTRGILVNVEFAEVFEVIRSVWRMK